MNDEMNASCLTSSFIVPTSYFLMMRLTGLLVILIGVGVIVVGLLIYAGALSWFGRLPGDIRYQGEHTRVYIPITSMLLVSLVLSLLGYVLRRFL
jgi:hypothetical protein